MIRSQMISFRPDSGQERNLDKYILLVEDVFAMIKQASPQNFCVNIIASSIRQVVLKNDCLESKNQLLDFFFLCEKTISQNSSKNTKKSTKNWIKIIQAKINQIKGFQSLCNKFKTLPLKWGFDSIYFKNSKPSSNVEPQIDIDSASIQVEEDIKLKTLYFFKWCKFIEYGKSIKKLRLKQIDDLRKSLTFNKYAVKFSYFHNWRRQAKSNALSRQKFDQIQKTTKMNLFRNTVNAFYSLFEIKKIQEKLVVKVEDQLKICKQQFVLKKLAQNKNLEASKQTRNPSFFKFNQSFKSEAQKIKFRFLYFLLNECEIMPIKSKTLTKKYNQSQQKYSLLCAQTALSVLKNQFYQQKQNIIKIKETRKSFTLEARFNQFKDKKMFTSNLQVLHNKIRQSKLKRFLSVLKFNSQIKKQLEKNQDQNLDSQISIEITQQVPAKIQPTCQTIGSSQKNIDLFKYLQFQKLKGVLSQKLQILKKETTLMRIKSFFMFKNQIRDRISKTILIRQSAIFIRLKSHHEVRMMKIKKENWLKQIYQKNLLKIVFSGMKKYKFIRLSHEETLQNIEQTIINPKQILTAFNRILEIKQKIQSCSIVSIQVNRFIMRTVFKKCFSDHIQTLQKIRRMEKRLEIKNLDLLFSFLKKNKQFNENKCDEIKRNVISNLNKVFFIKNLNQNYKHAKKTIHLYNFILEERQYKFVGFLKERRNKIQENQEKILKVKKMLGFELLKRKTFEEVKREEQITIKCNNFARFLKNNEFSMFLNELRIVKNKQTIIENKFNQISNKILQNKLTQLIRKINYEKSHKKSVIKTKENQIYKNINFKSYFQKFEHEAKNSYLRRWIDWQQKQNVFEKLSANQQFNKKITKIQITLNKCKIQFGWSVIKENIIKEREVLNQKAQQLSDFLGKERKKQIRLTTQKIKSIRQTQKSYQYLINALKTKYFSKYMRNSLIIKYQKVKDFCAIRSYARNVILYLMKLKQKSLNGFRIMLIRLRDKENRLKTQQEIIVKVDKAMYNSRKSHQLSETIQRFNTMKRSLAINVPR